jgi:hypothetical protein
MERREAPPPTRPASAAFARDREVALDELAELAVELVV